jgi:hypothetical protein
VAVIRYTENQFSFSITDNVIRAQYIYLLNGAESFLRSRPVFAASQEIPCILWNPNMLYRTHKCTPPISILNQLLPVPTTPSNFLNIHLNIILPSTSGSPQRPLSLRFPHQHFVHPSLLPDTRHMPRPSYSSRFNHPHNIRTQYIYFKVIWVW